MHFINHKLLNLGKVDLNKIIKLSFQTRINLVVIKNITRNRIFS